MAFPATCHLAELPGMIPQLSIFEPHCRATEGRLLHRRYRLTELFQLFFDVRRELLCLGPSSRHGIAEREGGTLLSRARYWQLQKEDGYDDPGMTMIVRTDNGLVDSISTGPALETIAFLNAERARRSVGPAQKDGRMSCKWTSNQRCNRNLLHCSALRLQSSGASS
jgi:hypothetical protein